ncbi:MAG: FAD-binding oxidoreductase [Candidatus Peribacteraceae bacterium]|nr:FAD-binding oxidoreductase [Candidatus Peribacteraceae bacterium]
MAPETSQRDPHSGKIRTQSKQPVLILGTGISGLSVANELLTSGKYDVTHWSDRPVEQMTSSKAAAFWYPVCVEGKEEQIVEWSEQTLHHFLGLLSTPNAGVSMKETCELHRKPKEKDPAWARVVADFRHAKRSDLPQEFVSAYLLTVPVAMTRYYLEYMLQKNVARGAKIEAKHVDDIQEALDQYDVVVNCTGMGARDLGGAKDDKMLAVRGDLVRIKNPGNISDILMDEDNPKVTYICPRTAPDRTQSDVILGGTFDEGNEKTEIDEDVAQGIIERCAQFHESIRGMKPLEHIVGHRPKRKGGVRVEEESRSGGKRLVWNVGHGGSGFTIAQGCAADVVKLIGK